MKTIKFEMGMEDGYATYSIGGQFTGYFEKDGPLPKNCRKPAIKTKEGWIEVTTEDYIAIDEQGQKTIIKGKQMLYSPDRVDMKWELKETFGIDNEIADSILGLSTNQIATLIILLERVIELRGGVQ